MAESIKRFGFAAPILARSEDCEIIAGHTRAQAAKLLGLPKVPVRFLDLDPADAHLLALADNRLNELGEWDESKLAELLGELRLQGNDSALVAGWSDDELDKLLGTAGSEVGAFSGEKPESFDVIVTCTDEAQQKELLQRLSDEGYKVRALIG